APVINHRGPEFHAMLGETLSLVKPLFGTTGEVLPFAASGTGVMEAAIANILAPGERVLVVINGQFGERFKAICEAFGAAVDTVDVEWGLAPDANLIAERVRKADYRAVFVTHNESSTGVVADLAAIGTAIRDRPALLVVDSVSGLGAMELRQEDWHLDIVVTASQKALMCPPGAGFASISPKAWEVINRADRGPRFFWDFRKAKTAAEKDETAFTPPVSLISGLRTALEMIHAEGIPTVFERHRRLGAALRAGGTALGLPVFTRAPLLSNSVQVFAMPETLEGGTLVRHMYQHYHTVIAGARNRLQGKVIRLGTMGYCEPADILTDLHYLERSLADLGRSVTPGAGVAAAAAVLAG
ncbi:MAG TPA: alanine--glyoxylate aminotransferase family protein, partial [Stellaceae bacterium]|nr:alanine--glyoxylate aminotransferase family protein [Stellaceae bacterium]